MLKGQGSLSYILGVKMISAEHLSNNGKNKVTKNLIAWYYNFEQR